MVPARRLQRENWLGCSCLKGNPLSWERLIPSVLQQQTSWKHGGAVLTFLLSAAARKAATLRQSLLMQRKKHRKPVQMCLLLTLQAACRIRPTLWMSLGRSEG